VVELKEEREYYLVSAAMIPVLAGETKLVKLYVCQYQNGTVFLCPVPQPGEDGKWFQWHKSLAEVMVEAEKHWVRAIPNMTAGGYDMVVPSRVLLEPQVKSSEKLPIEELIKLAFKDKIIEDEEHPVVKMLLGRD
jgi:hypothetical protein